MRTIKFRTHDKRSGAMEYVTLEQLADGDTFELGYENYDWMEFTGLFDKNGVEIYEGDIVQIDNAFGKIVGEYEVKWLEGKCGFDFWGFNRVAFGMSNSAIFEVIGNVYQNPELLNQD